MNNPYWVIPHDRKENYGYLKFLNCEIKLCGYFAIVTSDKMTAEEALILYKSRDGSEKTSPWR